MRPNAWWCVGMRHFFCRCRPFILDVGGVGRPVFSPWNVVRYWVGRAAMSLDQSLLSTLCRLSTSTLTVCNSGNKSRDSGIAIS